MNKLILMLVVLALLVSVGNTVLLLQVSGKLKDLGDKVEPVAKEIEKVQALRAPPGKEAKTQPTEGDSKPPIPFPPPGPLGK